jgi:hypothetical protein
LKKPITKKGLVEWLEVYALSSSPNTTKKEKKNTGKFTNMCKPVETVFWGVGVMRI